MASSESTGEGKGGSGGAGGHRRGAPCGAEGEGRDSPEALKDCSTRPTFTTCKERQVRQAPPAPPLSPSPSCPPAPPHTHPHEGYKLLAGVLIGAARGRKAGQGLGAPTATLAGLVARGPSRWQGPKPAPGPSPLPSLPRDTLSPTWQHRARYTRRQGVGPSGAGRGLACGRAALPRSGAAAPLHGKGDGRTWGGEGGRARQRHSKHKPIPDIKIKIETSLPWVPETKRRER